VTTERTRDFVDVWLVEDNTMLRESLAELIDEQADMVCGLSVGSCEEFMTAVDAGGVPGVVLMDIGLPGRSGIDGVARLRSASPSSKVVVFTIHAEDDKVFDAICAGATGYLLKPLSPNRIVDAIRDVDRGASPINAFIARKMLNLFSRIAPSRTESEAYGLTSRESEILHYLVNGLTVKRIAEELHLSPHTISNHMRSIYQKLHVRTRSRVVAKAIQEKLV
jgi:DNA-binding NarL/FixJ family response regulator